MSGRWEYAVVYGERHKIPAFRHGVKAHSVYENSELLERQGEYIPEILNELGQKGWEIISGLYDAQAGRQIIYLKRQM